DQGLCRALDLVGRRGAHESKQPRQDREHVGRTDRKRAERIDQPFWNVAPDFCACERQDIRVDDSSRVAAGGPLPKTSRIRPRDGMSGMEKRMGALDADDPCADNGDVHCGVPSSGWRIVDLPSTARNPTAWNERRSRVPDCQDLFMRLRGRIVLAKAEAAGW